MNRQQFLAELSQYLTFFSPEEKAQIISAYNEKFNSAGSEKEAALLAELGTPMMTAIDLKRRVEAGERISFAPENKASELSEPSEDAAETEAVSPAPDVPTAEDLPAEPENEVPAELTEDKPSEESTEEAPEASAQATPSEENTEETPEDAAEETPSEISDEAAPEAVAAETAAQELAAAEDILETSAAAAEEPSPEVCPVEIPEAPYEYPIAPVAPREVRAEPERPRRKVSVAKLILSSLLSIVITAFFLALAAVGVVVLVAMSYLLLAGLKNLVYVTDCLLLFGGGLVCAGLGILIVWFSVWAAGSLISGLFRSALGYGSDKEYEA